MRDDIDLKYFNKRLEERLKAITAGQERQKMEAAPVELDQARVGRLSRMDAMQQQAMFQAAARLTARYGKGKDRQSVPVRITAPDGSERTLEIEPGEPDGCRLL